MSYYCSNCSIHLTRLSQDDDGLEYCPLCKSDMHLTESDEPGYHYSFIDGSLTHEVTGEKTTRTYKNSRLRKIREEKQSTLLPYEEYLEKKQSAEDAAIDAYIETGDTQKYFDKLKATSDNGK